MSTQQQQPTLQSLLALLSQSEEELLLAASNPAALHKFAQSYGAILKSLQSLPSLGTREHESIVTAVTRVERIAAHFRECEQEFARVRAALDHDCEKELAEHRASLKRLSYRKGLSESPPHLVDVAPNAAQTPLSNVDWRLNAVPLRRWYRENLYDPFVNATTKEALVREMAAMPKAKRMNAEQCTLWFINARRRSGWTEFYRQFAYGEKDRMRILIQALEKDRSAESKHLHEMFAIDHKGRRATFMKVNKDVKDCIAAFERMLSWIHQGGQDRVGDWLDEVLAEAAAERAALEAQGFDSPQAHTSVEVAPTPGPTRPMRALPTRSAGKEPAEESRPIRGSKRAGQRALGVNTGSTARQAARNASSSSTESSSSSVPSLAMSQDSASSTAYSTISSASSSPINKDGNMATLLSSQIGPANADVLQSILGFANESQPKHFGDAASLPNAFAASRSAIQARALNMHDGLKTPMQIDATTLGESNVSTSVDSDSSSDNSQERGHSISAFETITLADVTPTKNSVRKSWLPSQTAGQFTFGIGAATTPANASASTDQPSSAQDAATTWEPFSFAIPAPSASAQASPSKTKAAESATDTTEPFALGTLASTLDTEETNEADFLTLEFLNSVTEANAQDKEIASWAVYNSDWPTPGLAGLSDFEFLEALATQQ